jgi:hypothetical protein
MLSIKINNNNYHFSTKMEYVIALSYIPVSVEIQLPVSRAECRQRKYEIKAMSTQATNCGNNFVVTFLASNCTATIERQNSGLVGVPVHWAQSCCQEKQSSDPHEWTDIPQ